MCNDRIGQILGNYGLFRHYRKRKEKERKKDVYVRKGICKKRNLVNGCDPVVVKFFVVCCLGVIL